MAKRDGRGGVLLRADRVYYAEGISPRFHRVRHANVKFYGSGIGSFDFEKLSTLKVRVLDVSYNDGRLFFPNLLLALPLFKKLTLLKLKQTNFFNMAPEAMVSALAETNITELDLTGNFIGGSTVSLRGLKLRSLRVSNTMIGSAAPLDGLLVEKLEFLDLSHNDLGSRSGEKKLEVLGEYLKQSTTLFSLNMSYNCLNAQRNDVILKFIESLGVLESKLDGPSNHDFTGNFSTTSTDVSAALESFHQRRTKRDDRRRTLCAMIFVSEQAGNIWHELLEKHGGLELFKLIFHY